MSILTNILGGGDLIREIGETVRQVIPNKEAQRNFDLKIAELADKAASRETELLKGQIDINKEEAKSLNVFVAGWRPFLGWTGGAALAYTWIIAPLIQFGYAVAGYNINMPALGADEIYPMIYAILGIGVMRTYEKTKGVASSIRGNVYTPVKPTEGPVAVQSTNDPVSPESVQEATTEVPKRRGWFD